jgi:hypothetical protein
MNDLTQYIFEIFGTTIHVNPIPKEKLDKFPMYITEIYKLHETSLFNRELLLAECKQTEDFSIMQTEKQFALIKDVMQKNVILCMNEITSFNRKRLIEKGINFIIPGKQLFLPELLIDLRENFNFPRTKKDDEKLQPAAQLLTLHFILDKYDKQKIENLTFKELATKFGYSSANSITNAVENLKCHEVIDVVGEKEKHIRFRGKKAEIWCDLEKRKLWTNPVLKKVYVDELPQKQFLLLSNASALPEYSDMNPSMQKYYAIEKFDFYALQKSSALVNANDYEGKYCLEVWKYNPLKLVEELFNDMSVVDPLSLYLNLADSQDERIEMALEQIIENYIF